MNVVCKNSVRVCLSVLLLILALSYIVTPATAQNREIRVVGTTVVSGRTVDLSVEIVAQGNENAIGFSLNFNPAILSNPVVTQGSGVAGATFNANTNQADI